MFIYEKKKTTVVQGKNEGRYIIYFKTYTYVRLNPDRNQLTRLKLD